MQRDKRDMRKNAACEPKSFLEEGINCCLLLVEIENKCKNALVIVLSMLLSFLFFLFQVAKFTSSLDVVIVRYFPFHVWPRVSVSIHSFEGVLHIED